MPETVLRESEVHPDPLVQFRRWFDEACATGIRLPEAMALATVGADGAPSARMVLMKRCDERGLVFYTDLGSRKAGELEVNPRAALLFHWAELERQVRIEGAVERVSAAEADAYFGTRPRGSQIGAWTSAQSRVAPSRQAIDDRYALETERLGDAPIARPPGWGGYLVRPDTIELWQGRRNRLHDRLRYSREPAGGWRIDRLWP